MRRALRARAWHSRTHARARRAQGRGHAARSDQNSGKVSALFNLRYKSHCWSTLENVCIGCSLGGPFGNGPFNFHGVSFFVRITSGVWGSDFVASMSAVHFPVCTREREKARARARARERGRRRVCACTQQGIMYVK